MNLRRIVKPQDVEAFPGWEAPDMDELNGVLFNTESTPRCEDPVCRVESDDACYIVRTADNHAWHIPLRWTTGFDEEVGFMKRSGGQMDFRLGASPPMIYDLVVNRHRAFRDEYELEAGPILVSLTRAELNSFLVETLANLPRFKISDKAWEELVSALT